MNRTRKIGALTGLAALIGTAAAAAISQVAMAAPVALEVSTELLMPGETFTITTTGCEDGIITLSTPNSEPAQINGSEAGTTTDPIAWSTVPKGELEFTATCSSDTAADNNTEATTSLYVFGAVDVEFVPEVFTEGQPVQVTAKDFAPDSEVTIQLLDADGSTFWTDALGTANAEFTVTGSVVYPTVECTSDEQLYDVQLTGDRAGAGEDAVVVGQVNLCGTEVPSETPSPTPSVTDTPSPSPTPIDDTPGLPHTGN